MLIRAGMVGAPSCGKTSVVRELEKRRFQIFPEAATSIIESEKSQGRSVQEIVTAPDFQDRIHRMKQEQFMQSRDLDGAVFFDTTFVDDVAHRRASWVEIISVRDCVLTNRYDVMFFLEHPWVVENNGIRLEDDVQALELDRLKREALAEFYYEPVIIPFFNTGDVERDVGQRVGVILAHLTDRL